MEAERDLLFEQIAAEANENAAKVGSSTSFSTDRNNHEARSSTSIIDLTSAGNVGGHAVDFGEEA